MKLFLYKLIKIIAVAINIKPNMLKVRILGIKNNITINQNLKQWKFKTL